LEEIANEKKVNKIIAITLPENKKSIRLIEKLGLKYEYNYLDKTEMLNLYSLTFNSN
jgi:RimJ/RimL family protein N-acetyltransferase